MSVIIDGELYFETKEASDLGKNKIEKRAEKIFSQFQKNKKDEFQKNKKTEELFLSGKLSFA